MSRLQSLHCQLAALGAARHCMAPAVHLGSTRKSVCCAAVIAGRYMIEKQGKTAQN